MTCLRYQRRKVVALIDYQSACRPATSIRGQTPERLAARSSRKRPNDMYGCRPVRPWASDLRSQVVAADDLGNTNRLSPTFTLHGDVEHDLYASVNTRDRFEARSRPDARSCR